ncbi:MAG: N-acetyltransferase [Candidatus Berkelbacteria bacterium]|nr:MAG: N-acetyltransferase [Candidatus Berkelbacteria bacterium]QQG51682.1 MAG: N-acetyltransferase [Candidatus Berkelbacteria bacterium]
MSQISDKAQIGEGTTVMYNAVIEDDVVIGQNCKIGIGVIINKGARLGDNVQVWHYSNIMGGAKIGNDCRIGKYVSIERNVEIGRGCKIQNHISIFEGVTLEDLVFCGPNMRFTNVLIPRCGFPRETSDDYVKTLVKRGATIGAGVTVVCGTTLGERCFVAAHACVTRDILPYALVMGVPAKQVGWTCECGNPLREHDQGRLVCTDCGRAYRESDGRLEPVTE